MRWSLQELRKFRETGAAFQEVLDVKTALLKRDDQILDAEPAEVAGTVTIDDHGYLLNYRVQVTLTVPSSRSLEPVELPLDFSVTEQFMTPEQFQTRSDVVPEHEILILEGQTLDTVESVLDNILLEIPMQILTEAEKASHALPKGQDWEVISEADYLQQKEQAAPTIDPRLAKLSQLLDVSDDEDNE
ncbi:YceD family protein [Enterococcus sp. AD013-P3]|uniref:YceD family protein n=1 Tax=Enterococcus sp. AD013-P3 TaxID=3411036 RepID=UPI003B945EBB